MSGSVQSVLLWVLLGVVAFTLLVAAVLGIGTCCVCGGAASIVGHAVRSAATDANAADVATSQPTDGRQRTWSAEELSSAGEFTVTELVYRKTSRGDGVYLVRYRTPSGPAPYPLEIPEAKFTPAQVRTIIREQIERAEVDRHNRNLLRR